MNTMSEASAPSPWGFGLKMCLVYGVLYWAYGLVPDQWLAQSAYPVLFTHPGVAIIQWLEPAAQVRAEANQIITSTVALEVVRGCDGTGALFLLLAALVAAEGVRWKARAWGALTGALMLYGLNEARLVALYFAAVHRPTWFNSLHEYFIPSLLVVSVGLFYLIWTALAGRSSSAES